MWSHMGVDCIIRHCTHLSYHCPRYIAFIDLTKAFNLVIRKGLFTLLQTMGCPLPPKLLRMITSCVGINLRPPSQSRAECNRAVYSLPHSSSCFSSYCCLTPSARKNKWCVTSHHKRWKPFTSPSKH